MHRHERAPDGDGGAVEEASNDVAREEDQVGPVAGDVRGQLLAERLGRRLAPGGAEEGLLFIGGCARVAVDHGRRCGDGAVVGFGCAHVGLVE